MNRRERGSVADLGAEETTVTNAESDHGSATDPEEDQVSVDEASFAQKWDVVSSVCIVTRTKGSRFVDLAILVHHVDTDKRDQACNCNDVSYDNCHIHIKIREE